VAADAVRVRPLAGPDRAADGDTDPHGPQGPPQRGAGTHSQSRSLPDAATAAAFVKRLPLRRPATGAEAIGGGHRASAVLASLEGARRRDGRRHHHRRRRRNLLHDRARHGQHDADDENRHHPERERPIRRRRRKQRGAPSRIRFRRTARAARERMGCLETRRGEPAIRRPEETDKEQHKAEDEDRDFHASPSSERDGRLMTFGLGESTRAPVRTT